MRKRSLLLPVVQFRAQQLWAAIEQTIQALTHSPDSMTWFALLHRSGVVDMQHLVLLRLRNVQSSLPGRSAWTSMHHLKRPIVLERFAVMNTQHQAIVSQLQPLLTQFVAFPKAVTNQELAQLLPVMLSTMLLPEMEQEQGRLQDQLKQHQLAADPAAAQRSLTNLMEDLSDLERSGQGGKLLDSQGDGTPFAAAWGAKRRTAARRGDLPAETPTGKALLAALHTGKGLS
eukprot:jgi/Astpho2/8511/Aster-x1523